MNEGKQKKIPSTMKIRNGSYNPDSEGYLPSTVKPGRSYWLMLELITLQIDHRPALPLVQHQKIVILYNLFRFIVIYCKRASMLSVTASWQGVDVPAIQ